MPRGALSGAGRTARTKPDQSSATEPPKAGTERDGVTYGETVTLGGEEAKAGNGRRKSSTAEGE